MMQQQMMAAGGGMMPYRMFEGQDTPNLHGAAKEQALRELMAQGYSREAAENMLADMRAKSLASEMSAFRNQTSGEAPPWSPAMQNAFITGEDLSRFRSGADARMTGEASPSSYGDIYPREQLEPVVDTAVGTANTGGEYKVGEIDGASIIGEVESKYPLLQRNLGPETGTAAARMFPSLEPSLRAAGRFVTDATADLGPNISDVGGELYDLGSSAAGGVSDLASNAAGSVYSTLEDMGLVNNQAIRGAIEPSLQAAAGGLDTYRKVLNAPFVLAGEALSSLPGSIPEEFGMGDARQDLLARGERGVGSLFSSLIDSVSGAFKDDASKVTDEERGDSDITTLTDASDTADGLARKDKQADEKRKEGERGPVPVLTGATPNALTTAATSVGTGAETEEDTEGLLKALFGRSYKPMDDGALALINLGAGIAKGDITGGMQSAVTAMGEERDRRRKEDLSSAQAEFYRSGQKGASKDSLLDMLQKAKKDVEDMGFSQKKALLAQMLGKEATREQLNDPRFTDALVNFVARQYAQYDQISARDLANSPFQSSGNRGTGNNTVDKVRFVQQHNRLIGQ
jgi:hypothetical protein